MDLVVVAVVVGDQWIGEINWIEKDKIVCRPQ
jgi:hypothetical protein